MILRGDVTKGVRVLLLTGSQVGASGDLLMAYEHHQYTVWILDQAEGFFFVKGHLSPGKWQSLGREEEKPCDRDSPGRGRAAGHQGKETAISPCWKPCGLLRARPSEL